MAALTLLYFVVSQPAATAQEYTLIDIGGLLGGRNIARGLSLSGELAGRSGNQRGTGTRAFAWTPAGGFEVLGALPGGDYSGAFAINASGEVVGSSNTPTAIRAFRWTRQSGMEDLGALPGDNGSKAYAINNAGQVAGYSSGPSGVRAFLWTRSGGMQNLGTLPGYDSSIAVDINEPGNLVGHATRADGTQRAVRWSPGIQNLGVLPAPYNLGSKAYAINNAGQVVGYSSGPGGVRAFLWTANDGMRDLGALPGGSNSRALYINESGSVVGSSAGPLGSRAFLWRAKDGMRDLNDLVVASGVELVEALSINQLGLIVAVGVRSDQEGRSLRRAAVSAPQDGGHESPTTVVLLIPR